MTNRRQILQLGVSISTLSFLPAGTHAMVSATTPRQTVGAVLHDTRFGASAALARNLMTAFARPPGLVPLDGDISRFWMQNLSRTWQEGPQALAGVTGADILFCLAQLARDQRLRVQWRVTVSRERDETPALVAWVIAGA